MKVLLDHNLSRHIAKALHAVLEPDRGHEVLALRQKFARDAEDVEWLGTLGAEGDWIVITKDQRIRRSPAERLAFRQSGLKVFVLGHALGRLKTVELTGRLLLRWEMIEAQAQLISGAAMFELPIRGRLRQLSI